MSTTTIVIIICVLLILVKFLWVNFKETKVVKVPIKIVGFIIIALLLWWGSGLLEEFTGIPRVIPFAAFITYGIWKNI